MIVTVFNNQGADPERYSFAEQEVIVGRNPPSDSSVIIDSLTVSRKHLRVQLNGDEVRVMDLDTSNGSYIGEEKLKPMTWQKVERQNKIKLAEFQGYIQVQKREQDCGKRKIDKINNKSSKAQKKEQSQSSDSESRERSRQKKRQLPFKLSESTMKMVKDMTINKKSKEERIKFLKLMGIGKAEEYWPEIQELLKTKKGIKDSQKRSDQLQRQFNSSRSGIQKKGLGKF